MHSTPGRLLIGVLVGVAGMFTLPDSSTRLPALTAWIVAWVLIVVLREARNDRIAAAERDAPDEP